MKKLLTVGLILSLSIGSAQAKSDFRTGGFKPSGVSVAGLAVPNKPTKQQIQSLLRQVRQQAIKAAKEAVKFQKEARKNAAAQAALNASQAAQQRYEQAVKKYEMLLQRFI